MSLGRDRGYKPYFDYRRLQQIVSTKVDVLRLVLMGKTGSGKSSTGNTIIDKNVFESKASATSVTNACQKDITTINGQKVEVVDTPGFFDTTVPTEKVTQEISRCVTMTTPGPHAFLFVVSVGRFTEEEINTVKLFVRQFGENVKDYMIVVLSRADELDGESLDSYLGNAPTYLKDFIKTCGNRYVAIDNKNKPRGQVLRMLELINKTVNKNGNAHYTNAMYKENADMLKAREEDLRKKHAEEEKRKIEILEAKFRDKVLTEKMKYKKEIVGLQRDVANHEKEANRLREATSATKQSLEVKELTKYIETLKNEVVEQGRKHEENMRSLQLDMNKKSKQEIEILQKKFEIEKEQLVRQTADFQKRSDTNMQMVMTFMKQQNQHHKKQIDLLNSRHQNELDMLPEVIYITSDDTGCVIL